MNEARCTVGLLTWNPGIHGANCARSLASQSESPLDIIWIDNASTDGSLRRISEICPKLHTPIVNPVNIGFCAGHNQALANCRTRYYLALNQDVILAPDYIERLCDWMDAEPELALVSGLILWGEIAELEAQIYSAGLVWPRVGFPFELRMGWPVRAQDRMKRRVPGVTGAAMMLRVDACRKASIPETEIFPNEFFAYHEEVDLALRLARAGLACGVDGEAVAWHAGQGSGGLKKRKIRAGYFANHWLLPLRHESWSMMFDESLYTARGELQYWLPRYIANPVAFGIGMTQSVKRWPAARGFYHAFEQKFGNTEERVQEFKRQSLELLRQAQN